MSSIEEIIDKCNNNFDLKQISQTNKNSYSFKNVIIKIVYSLLLIFMILTIAKVPYIGIYLDACFNYFFGGIIKYLWYLLILFALFFTFFRKTRT